VLITHNPDVARFAERRIHLRDGEVVAEEAA
jgi:ABC-type lipoprotein export system ATPase subunit